MAQYFSVNTNFAHNLKHISKLITDIKSDFSRYRSAGTDVLSAVVFLFFKYLTSAFVPLNRGIYHKLASNFSYFYPQIEPDRPRLFDPLRILVQSIWLLYVPSKSNLKRSSIGKVSRYFYLMLYKIFLRPARHVASRVTIEMMKRGSENSGSGIRSFSSSAIYYVFLAGSLAMALLCITQPLDITYQFIFVMVMWVMAMIFKQINNRTSLLLLIFISLMISSRYIWWRATRTILIEDPVSTICSFILLSAEVYAFVVMILSYFQVCWVLNRKPYPLPENRDEWPTVDIMIPSYNESLDVVRPCLLAAIDLDWPKEKLNVYLLDDGSRDEFKEYAEKIGVKYIRREIHNHAKAGNINNALKHSNGSIIAIFDCDHIPCRNFLTMTVGWMVCDPKIALVQTPHYFYSEDPFEKNLNIRGKIPSEDSLFHEFIQRGNDTWNSTMFCGSCAIIRRAPLEAIGGIAVETVTEDAHTSLRLNAAGWKSACIATPLAAGLSTESLAAHINQRIRWARGMVQIFRVNNPLFTKGLSLAQRVCFTNATVHFLHGLPRLIFLTAPLPYLFFNIYVIFASGIAILAYVLPHIVHSTITSQQIQGKNRFYFWGAIYETVLSWYITIPTLVALIAPKYGKFNVTDKGMSNDRTYYDWNVSKPYIILILLNLAGLFFGIYKMIFDPFAEGFTIFVNLLWVLYNLLVLGASAAVALEARQIRKVPRTKCRIRTAIELGDDLVFEAAITDFSQSGMGMSLPEEVAGEKIDWEKEFGAYSEFFINVAYENKIYRFRAEKASLRGRHLGCLLKFDNIQENIEYIRCTYASAGRWQKDEYRKPTHDSLLNGIHTLVTLGFNGYLKMIRFTPLFLRYFLTAIVKSMIFVFSFFPCQPYRQNKSGEGHENTAHVSVIKELIRSLRNSVRT